MKGAAQAVRLLLALAAATACSAASAWSFTDASLSVHTKGQGIGSGRKESLGRNKPVPEAVKLHYKDVLKISLTTALDKKAQRPQQCFLTLSDPDTKLEYSIPAHVRANGKGKLELTQKNLPLQFYSPTIAKLNAYLVIGSFGANVTPLRTHVFDVQVVNDEPAHAPSAEQAAAALNPVRYGKKEPQQHTFKADPKSAPRLLTYLFIIPVVAALPALLLVWIKQGANLAHVGHAFRNAPASHAIFLASVFALEAVFFLYYTHWKLFELLPAAGVAGLVAYLSGSRALTEVQERRLAGLR